MSSANFVSPKSFIPERWLGTDLRYANDQLQASQPFSVGPRNCIGQAYVSYRTARGRLLTTGQICDGGGKANHWADSVEVRFAMGWTRYMDRSACVSVVGEEAVTNQTYPCP